MVLRLAMEHADGDKCKIVFTSPEAMMEFSGEKKLKLSLSARQKNLLTYANLKSFERSRYFFLRQKQNSPITSHARLASCKECFHISNRPLPFHVHTFTCMKFLSYLTHRLSFCLTNFVKVQVSWILKKKKNLMSAQVAQALWLPSTWHCVMALL